MLIMETQVSKLTPASKRSVFLLIITSHSSILTIKLIKPLTNIIGISYTNEI